MRVSIVGSRRRDTEEDRKTVYDILDELVREFPKILIVSGGCREGADRFAKEYAKERKIPYVEFQAYGSNIPEEDYYVYAQIKYMRNELVAKYGDRMYALVTPDRSGGTENAIEYAHKHGRRVFLVFPSGIIMEDAPEQHPDQQRLPF